MLRLIGSDVAICTQRVLMTLQEMNIKNFTMYSPDVMSGEHKKPEHIAKHPFGLIPVLEDENFTLYESRAICRYLAAKYPEGAKLIPDPKDRQAVAIFEQAASVEQANFDAVAGELIAQKLFNVWRGMTPIPEVVDLMTHKLSAKLDIYDNMLAKQRYMAGNEFSLIDIFYMPNTEKFFEAGVGDLITSRPNVKAWWDRVSSRATWKATDVKL